MPRYTAAPSSFVAALALALLGGSNDLAAQDTIPAPPAETLPPASPAVLAPTPPPPPTPEQERYIEGLRSVARGVAQLRDGIDRVARTQQRSDSIRARDAGRRLGGLCQSARSFISTGRPRMQPSAYGDSMRSHARQLTVRVDSVLKALPGCVQNAGKAPGPVAADLLNRLRAYEQALAAFREGLAAPTTDSNKTSS